MPEKNKLVEIALLLLEAIITLLRKFKPTKR